MIVRLILTSFQQSTYIMALLLIVIMSIGYLGYAIYLVNNVSE